MHKSHWLRDYRKLSKGATIIAFLALIRCLFEPFRLEGLSEHPLGFAEVKPFLLGAMTSAVSLLVMVVLSYFGKYKSAIMICLGMIVILLIIKMIYIGF